MQEIWPLHNKTKITLMTSFAQVAQIYKARGFRICNITADGAFKCIRNAFDI